MSQMLNYLANAPAVRRFVESPLRRGWGFGFAREFVAGTPEVVERVLAVSFGPEFGGRLGQRGAGKQQY